MPVTSVKLAGITGAESAGGFTGSHIYIVKSSTPLSIYQAVHASVGSDAIPSIDDPHPDYPTALVTTITPVETSGNVTARTHWQVTVSYADADLSSTRSLAWTIAHGMTISWADSKIQVPLEWALETGGDFSAGDRIVNTVGDPWDPPFMIAKSRLTFTQSKPRFVQNAGMSIDYLNTVNSSSVNIAGETFAARTCKITGFSWTTARHNDTPYYMRTIVIECLIDGSTWDVRLLNSGPRAYAPGTTDCIEVTNDNGTPSSGVRLLLANGEQALSGASAHYLIARGHYEADWSPLSLEDLPT